MKGVFRNVRKYKNGYCFITGEDGVDYFFPKDNLVNTSHWNKFVWNGNSCEFDVEKSVNEKNDRAINVVPERRHDPLENQRRIKAEEQKIAHEEKQRQKEVNIRKQENYLRDKEDRLQHLRYVVAEKPAKGEPWDLYAPVIIFMDSDECKKEVDKLKDMYKDKKIGRNFKVMKVYSYAYGNQVVLRSVLPGKSMNIGELLFQGTI